MTSVLRSGNGRRAPRTAAIAALLTGLTLAGCGQQSEPQSSANGPSSTPKTSSSKQGAQLTVGTSMDASKPVSISIPAIDIRNSRVIKLGLDKNDRIETPPLSKPKLTGWYKHGPTPGELGPAVILGHIDNEQGPAVFYDLEKLDPGAKVKVTREDGSVAVFKITKVQQVPKKKFPTQRVYGELDHAGLRLITCGGVFNEKTQHYKDNIIAYGKLVASHKAKAS